MAIGGMDLLTKPEIQDPGTGSPDDKAHYVRKEDAAKAAVEGGKVRALCGVLFEPVRDPERFPTCEDCVRILNQFGERGNN